MRRTLRRLAITVIAILAVLAIVVLTIHTRPFRQLVLRQLIETLDGYGIVVAGENLRYNLLALSVDLDDVRIGAKGRVPELAVVGHLRAQLSLAQLLRGRYVLRAGRLDGVRVHYVVDDTGEDNLPRRPAREGDSTEATTVLVEELSIASAAVRYEDRLRDTDVALSPVSLQVHGDRLRDRHRVQLDVGSGIVQIGDRQEPVEGLSGAFDVGRDDLTVERLRVGIAGAQADASGSLRSFDHPIADLALHGLIDVARVGGLARLAHRVGGQAAFEATVAGPLSAPALDMKVDATGLSVDGLAGMNVESRTRYDHGQARARVDLHLEAPWGEILGNGNVSVDGGGDSEVALRMRHVDAATVMSALELPYVLATRIEGRADARWGGADYLGATGSAEAALTAARKGTSRGALPVSGRLSAKAARGEITLLLDRIAAASATVSGRVAIADRERIDGRVVSSVSDLSAALAAAESFLRRPPGSLASSAVEGGLTLDTRLGGTLRAPRAAAHLDAPDLTVEQVSGLSLRGDADYADAVLTVPGLDVGWQQARAHASGVVELQGAQRLDLALHVTEVDVAAAVAAMNRPALPVGGLFSAHGSIAGTLQQPRAWLSLEGHDLVAYDEPLGGLVADLNYTDQRIEVPSLVLSKPQLEDEGTLTASAMYDIDADTYRFDAQSSNLRLTSLNVVDGEPIRGRLELRARGEGTTAEPSAELTLAADDLVMGARELGGVTVKAEVADRQATIRASAERFQTTATATASIVAPYPSTVDARLEGLPLARLPLEPTAPLDGQLTAHVIAHGNLAEPVRARADLTIDRFDATWNGQPFDLDGPALVRYAEERLEIDRLVVTAQGSSVSVSGQLPTRDGTGEGNIRLEARALLGTLMAFAPADLPLSGEGQLTLSGSIRGTLTRIDPDLTLGVEDGLILGQSLEPGITGLNLRAVVRDGAATLETLSADWGTAHLEATAHVPLDVVPELPVALPRQGGISTLEARLTSVDLAAVPSAPAGLSGRVNLEAHLSASRPALDALDGQVAFQTLQLGFNGLTLEQAAPTTLSFHEAVARIEPAALSGSVGTINASGTIGLVDPYPLDVGLQGELNVAAASVLREDIQADGDARLNLTARGTAAAPDLHGVVELTDTAIAVDEPGIAAEHLDARIELDGARLTLSSLAGMVNGGELSGSGVVTFGAQGVDDINLQVATTGFAFDAPLDLRSLSNATMRVTKQDDLIRVDGDVAIQEAGLTGDIDLGAGLLGAIGAPRTLELTEERNPLLERVRFNVHVGTETPVLVDNNLAKAEVTVDLRVLGTPYEPGLSGRLDVLEGGEVTLNGRRLEVERGAIMFSDDRRIVPTFDLRLTTTASDHDIAIAITGSPGDTESAFTSEPPLPEPEIISLLVTGRTLDEMRGEEYDVAREQVLSYLTGRVGSTLGRGIERATGLSEVRIEPDLIANETDPSARLTLAQDLTEDLSLVYSTDLADSNDQVWVARYDLTRRFQSRVVRQSDNSYRVDFRHDFRLGGQPEPKRLPRRRPTVRTVTVPADVAIGEAELRHLLGVDQGDQFDFFAARKGVERIASKYIEHGWLESRITLERTATDEAVDLDLKVTTGPRVDLTVVGIEVPGSIHRQLQEKWHRGVFDTQRTDDCVELLRGWLMEERYLNPRVTYDLDEPTPQERRITLRVEPGQRFQTVEVRFEGAVAIQAKELNDIIDGQHLERQLFTDPVVVTELLRRYYREQGFLAASIDRPRIDFQGAIAHVVVPVVEGPKFSVRRLTFARNAVIPEAVLAHDLPLSVGDPFLPAAAEQALQRIRELYWQRAHNDVRTAYTLAIDRTAGVVDLAFDVDEGRPGVIAAVDVQGTDQTSEHLVREQMEIEVDQPLNLAALSRSRKSLYDTGAFSVVDITRETAEAPGSAAPETGDGGVQEEQYERIRVNVREVQPFQFRYGASYDTERGLGGVFEVSNHNSLGKARVLGLSSRYDSQIREARGYLTQPSLRYFPLATTASIYYREEHNPATDVSDPFDVTRQGVSLQQERKLRNAYVWSYGYRYERARTTASEATALEEDLENATVSPLTTTFTRETRDEILDASRGSFFSQAFSYSPTWLGSDDSYLKYFGQYSHYVPLQAPTRKPFTNEWLRPRLIFATSVRLGLAHGFGADLPRSERFFAGGSTTLRGFEQNTVGPLDTNRIPTGGNALLVLNNELRFPLVSIVDGVAFLDVGGVFPRVSDFSLVEIRESAGMGLRLRTPWFLVRGDYGWVLDRRAGEKRARFYFSIGQAF